MRNNIYWNFTKNLELNDINNKEVYKIIQKFYFF